MLSGRLRLHGRPERPTRVAFLVLAATLGPTLASFSKESVVPGVESVTYEVAKEVPHRTDCFSEGLFMDPESHEMWESCGLTGKSYLRRYALESGETLQTTNVPKELFSEGLVRFGTSLFMLTYHHKQVLEYDAQTLVELRRHPFTYGEGWGLTTDGCDLLATTGSSYIFRLRLVDGNLVFVSKVQVHTGEGTALNMLNELEYVTPKLWVNQWLTNRVFRVDPVTGLAEKQVSVKGLHPWRGQATPNGLAYSVDGLGEDRLLVTGKLWPKMFILKMSQEDICGPSLLTAPTCPAAPASACYSIGTARPGSTSAGADTGATEVAHPPVSPEVVGASSSPSSGPLVGEAPAPISVSLVQLPSWLYRVATLGASGFAVLAVCLPYRILNRRRQYKVVAQDV